MWWRRSVRFCAHGVLWDGKLLRWDHATDHEWYALDSALLKTSLRIDGIDQHGVDMSLNIGVPPNQHEAVQTILDQHLAERPANAFTGPIRELGTMSLSAAIRDRRFPKYLGSIGLAIVLMIVSMRAFTTGLTGIAEFDQSIIFGLFASSMGGSWRWRCAGQKAGAPLIRLSGRRSWWEFTAFMLFAATFFAIGSRFFWSSSVIAYAAGIGFGWMAATTITSVAWRQVDLRANGVVAQGCFWPWTQVKLVRWDGHTSGRLVLARGWRRVVGIAVLEQRDAVEALLKKKLPDSKSQEEQEVHTRSP
jgi:hypothetical protein